MRNSGFKVWTAVAVLGLLASLACENRARADDLYLGGTYNSFDWQLTQTVGSGTTIIAQNEGGGSISPSTLNGVALPWVYCIDIPDNVGVPADYNTTAARFNGMAAYSSGNLWPGTPGLTYAGGSAPIAGQIAYILDNFANAANVGKTSQVVKLQQEAVQAAIWTLIYNNNPLTPTISFTVTDSTVATAAGNILTAAAGQTASLSSVVWLSPNGNGLNGAASPDSTGSPYQALVTGGNSEVITSVTPEPSTFAIATLCGAGFVFYGLRRRKAEAKGA